MRHEQERAAAFVGPRAVGGTIHMDTGPSPSTPSSGEPSTWLLSAPVTGRQAPSPVSSVLSSLFGNHFLCPRLAADGSCFSHLLIHCDSLPCAVMICFMGLPIYPSENSIKFKTIFKTIIIIIPCMCVWVPAYARLCVWRSEDRIWKLVIFYLVEAGSFLLFLLSGYPKLAGP